MNNLIEKYKLNLNEIKSIDWKTEESNENSILFYKFNSENINALELFEKRIKDSKFKYCIVNSKKINIQNVIPIESEDWSELQKQFCDKIYPIDLNTKKIVGITGTNGKTTTTDIIRQILVNEKKSVLTIGTLGVWKNEENISNFGLTSPSYIDLRKIIFQNNDVQNIICEVSSHALDQNRYYGIKFDAAVWTSFSQDHLDYHKTMDDYFNSKAKIITKLKKDSKLFISKLDIEILSKLKNIEVEKVENNIKINNEYFKVPYNLKNLSLAEKVIVSLGINITQSFETLKPTPGRYNILSNKNPGGKVIIDFAHTPDAIENIARVLKITYPEMKLVIVFGCGGDRDKIKRPLMAKAASLFADYVYVTTDNPRFESPSEIIKDIIQGTNNKNFEIIEDRAIAIKTAINKFPNEIILIAGKGHENYIDQNGSKRYYSDEAEVLKGISND
jgi:UDP-N-acetylmuramoyl-L-alanyl-D-glutamate--2,6-diaminopimelate ligase